MTTILLGYVSFYDMALLTDLIVFFRTARPAHAHTGATDMSMSTPRTTATIRVVFCHDGLVISKIEFGVWQSLAVPR